MRICFPFVGNSLGGSHLSSIELLKKLKDHKFNVIIVLHKKGFFFDYLKKNKIKFYFLPLKKLAGESSNPLIIIYLLIKNFFKIRNFLNQHKINLVHGNDLKINLTWSFSCFLKTKYVWHQRTLFRKNSFLFFPMFFFPQKIISISHTVQSSLPILLRKKSKIIYNPIERKKILNRKINKKISIAYLGDDTFNKGFDIFLNIVDCFKKNKKYKFNAYGIKKIKKNRRTNLKVYKFVDVIQILNNNDMLIAPSRREGFGRSIIEFALSNKFVLASNIEAFREIDRLFININIVKNSFNVDEFVDNILIFNFKKRIKTKKNLKNLAKLNPTYHFEKVKRIYFDINKKKL